MSPPMVLLIEACDARRYAVRLELKPLGAEVRQAHSVEQALALVDERPPELIICAPSLPGMNALDLLELLRLRYGAGAAPVVIHCHDETWPLAGAALQRGALAVVGSTALAQGLPTWLRAGSAPAQSAVAATMGTRARRSQPPDHMSERALPSTAGASAPAAPAQRGVLVPHCFGQVLAGVLLGLLLGLWITAMLAP
ncbi:response regulator [Thiohalocapsa halophila]